MYLKRLFTLLLILLSLSSTIVLAEPHSIEESKQLCYLFNHANFQHTLPRASALKVNIIFDKEEIKQISLDSNATKSQHCSYDCNATDTSHFTCRGDTSKEQFAFYLQDNALFLHATYLQFITEEGLVERITSKSTEYTKGESVPCYPSVAPIFQLEHTEENSVESALLQTINIPDIIVYDIDHKENLVIAVGEDNSPATREKQSQDEFHIPVILRSTDKGVHWEKVIIEPIYETPNDHVIILDTNHTLISSSHEGSGGLILHSKDGGKHWQEVYHGHYISSLHQERDGMISAHTLSRLLVSKDQGMTWQEEVPNNDCGTLPNTSSTELEMPSSIAMLSLPTFALNYENNHYSIQHAKHTEIPDQLSLSLIYHNHSIHSSLLGDHWVMGEIEDRIGLEDDGNITYFNAFKGNQKRYFQTSPQTDTFRATDGEEIQKTPEGFTKTTENITYYFDTNGTLIKIAYPKTSYLLSYRKDRLQTIKQLTNGTPRPFIDFHTLYEGKELYFHDLNQTITLLFNRDGVISDLLYGNHQYYHYTYQKATQLTAIQNPEESTLLSIETKENKTLRLKDHTQLQSGIKMLTKYTYLTLHKTHSCIVSHLKQTPSNTPILTNHLYTYEYYDTEHQQLKFTSNGLEQYGFSKSGHLTSYTNGVTDINVSYYPFQKVKHSVVTQGDQTKIYDFTYTEDEEQQLLLVEMSDDKVELHYNAKNQIDEMQSKRYHLRYRYNQTGLPVQIIVVGKGEMHINYNTSGEIIQTSIRTYLGSIPQFQIAQETADAFAYLLSSIEEGTIKEYPKWLQ